MRTIRQMDKFTVKLLDYFSEARELLREASSHNYGSAAGVPKGFQCRNFWFSVFCEIL